MYMNYFPFFFFYLYIHSVTSICLSWKHDLFFISGFVFHLWKLSSRMLKQCISKKIHLLNVTDYMYFDQGEGYMRYKHTHVYLCRKNVMKNSIISIIQSELLCFFFLIWRHLDLCRRYGFYIKFLIFPLFVFINDD